MRSGQLRIIGGRYKRKSISTPAGDTTRPTADRVRENIFNILQGNFVDARVLDLFSGSGALGIESLSRGAKHVTFVESNPNALTCIRGNLDSVQAARDAFAVCGIDVTEALAHPAACKIQPASIDIVLADPPYRSGWYALALAQLESSGICAPGCIAMIEMPSDQPPLLQSVHPWTQLDARQYGAARIEIWQRGSLDEDDQV